MTELNPYQPPSKEDFLREPTLFRRAVGLLMGVPVGVITFFMIPGTIFAIAGHTTAGQVLGVISLFVGIVPAFYLAQATNNLVVLGRIKSNPKRQIPFRSR